MKRDTIKGGEGVYGEELKGTFLHNISANLKLNKYIFPGEKNARAIYKRGKKEYKIAATLSYNGNPLMIIEEWERKRGGGRRHMNAL